VLVLFCLLLIIRCKASTSHHPVEEPSHKPLLSNLAEARSAIDDASSAVQDMHQAPSALQGGASSVQSMLKVIDKTTAAAKTYGVLIEWMKGFTKLVNCVVEVCLLNILVCNLLMTHRSIHMQRWHGVSCQSAHRCVIEFCSRFFNNKHDLGHH
jgi:hypothetical protein